LQEALQNITPGGGENVYLLTENPATPKVKRLFSIPADAENSAGVQTRMASSRENIERVLRKVRDVADEETNVFVYLIGHGSHRRGISKLAIPGADISADELGVLLDALPASHQIVINSASASAGFINVLSAPGRIICTATKGVEERNATEFMRFFVEALETGAADRDRDERISVLELCSQAAILTANWYESEGLILSEHALLDDNGDGLGTRLPIDSSGIADQSADSPGDGRLAASVWIKELVFPAHVPEDLIAAYQAALERVEAFKEKKAELPADEYYERLEELLVRAARANRAIHVAAEQGGS